MTDNENNKEQQIALVTGGSRGIGRECVIELTKAGHNVAFSYSSDVDGANETIKLASQEGTAP
ncbi:MAG TPA: SDR family NAD(P)-dependent oxidoreductase, partial [Acidimicrobiia bacterium]|nr:SDR family NAD(P)-dependent oxidoreductase [Acidimicrobiia bacterium]